MADMLVYGTLGTNEYSLVNLVRNYPVLYNPQDPGHHDRGRIDATWTEIGRQLSKDKEWCFTKWASLLDDYKKRKAVYDSMGASVTMMSWLQYDPMSFLDLYQNNPQRDNINCQNTITITPQAPPPPAHAPPTEICYTNGVPGHGHQTNQQQHHPSPQIPHQQLITGVIMDGNGMLHPTTQENLFQLRTIFKCPNPNCQKTFVAEDKLREHLRNKQCMKFSQNVAAGNNVQVTSMSITNNGAVSNNLIATPTGTLSSAKKKKVDGMALGKYADENMGMLPIQGQGSSAPTPATNSNNLNSQPNDHSGGGGTGNKSKSGGGSKNSTKVTCTGCGRTFQGKNSKYALKKHYQSHYHDGPSSWGFTCNICGKKCQFQFKLDEHMRTHSKEQPFECDQCGRKFSIKFNLKRHIKLIHKIETPYLKSQNMKNV